MPLSSDDPLFTRVEVDGQTLLIPDPSLLDELRHDNTLDGRPLGTGRLFDQFAKLSEVVAGLDVALGAVQEPGKPWWIYHVVKQPFGHQRVHIESIRCRCGFRGLGGNSRDFSLYIGTKDPLAAMMAHEGSPKAPCPACGVALERPCVFVAPAP